MEEEHSEALALLSSDGIKENISRKAAIRSNLIKNLLEINPDSTEIPLKVKGSILKKIKEYLEHYENIEPIEIEKPLHTSNLKECVVEWDYNYTDIDLSVIFDMIIASNYMGIKSLVELCSAKAASLIKCDTTEEIRQKFNIHTDFTPEEEQEILEENKYFMEEL